MSAVKLHMSEQFSYQGACALAELKMPVISSPLMTFASVAGSDQGAFLRAGL